MVLKWVCPKPHGASSCLHTNTNPPAGKKTKNKGEIDVKKVISIALALLMVAVMLPVMAMAADVVVEKTLTDNITQSITVNQGETCTLNLSGKTLTNEAGKDTIYVKMGGTLIINGPGTVDNVSHGRAAIFNNGTVILNGGTYTRSREAGTAASNSDNGNSWYTICNHGDMTVNAGVTVTNTGTYSSVFENGYYNYTDNPRDERSNFVQDTNHPYPKLTINGGTFEGGKITIKNDDGGILEINDGRFTNDGNRVVYNVNKAEINGGDFNCPAGYFDNKIAVDTRHANNDINVGELAISGGAFNGRITKNDNSDVGITGGTFNTDVTEYTTSVLVVKDNNGKYYVGEDAKKAVENTNSGTLFVEDAGAGEALNVKPGVTIVNNSRETIKVNGNEVAPEKSYTVPGTPIIIYNPTEDTPKADDQKNPSTGANDFVGVAAAMAVVSLLGAAAVIRKK